MASTRRATRTAPGRWRDDPRHIRPMLAVLAPPGAHARLLATPTLVFEPKYDGIRALVALDGPAAPTLYSRLGRDKTGQFPEIVEALAVFARRLRRPLLLDGEIVAVDEAGVALPFQHLQSRLDIRGRPARAPARATAAALVVFDLLRDGDDDLRPLPFTERRQRLERIMPPSGSAGLLRLIDSTTGDGAALAEQRRADGGEGVIAKSPTARYHSGTRHQSWQKIKFTHTEDFVVGGWTAPRRSRRHFGALLLGYYPAEAGPAERETLVFAGQVGSGFTEAALDRVAALLAPLAVDESPFAELPSGPRPEPRHWVEPRLVARTAFTQWTLDGVLRHPVYQGLRDDVRPTDIRMPVRRPAPDHPDAPPPRPTAGRRGGAKGSRRHAAQARRPGAPPPPHPEPALDHILAQLDEFERRRRRATLDLSDGTRLPVGNLHKIFWPEPGLTKGDLVRFYLRMAPYLLPVVADRPLVMKRFPNGVDSPSFYQHRAPDPMPDGVRVAVVRERPEKPASTGPYLVGGTLQTLLYMAQLGVISQDPWFSTLPDLEAADLVALDLDPMPDAAFEKVLDVACWIHDELDRLGVPGFAKTSGSKGIHIFIPLPPGTPYEAGMIFCQIVATVVATRHPTVATMERTVKKRPAGIVYIDSLQNIYGKTLASAYSARASPFAGVSTPLTWEEVHDGAKAGLAPHDFTMRSIFTRLDQVGDLWAALRTTEPARLEAAFAYEEK